MEDPFGVTVSQALDDLLEKMFSNVFLQLPPSANIGKEVSSTTNFHDEHDVLGGL